MHNKISHTMLHAMFMLLFISLLPFVAAEVDPDNPETWTEDYVHSNPDVAFDRDMMRAVELEPALLAFPDRAERYFSYSLGGIVQYTQYAQRYLARTTIGIHNAAIANYYVDLMDARGQLSLPENLDIANRYFASAPSEVNNNKELFTRFMVIEGVTLTLEGNVAGYTEAGGLSGNGNQINVQRFKNTYAFHVAPNGRIQLIPKGATKEKAFDFTGIILARETEEAGQKVALIQMQSGTINGIPIKDGKEIRLMIGDQGERVLFAGGVARMGGLHFAVAAPVRYDFDSKTFALANAKIARVDSPVRVYGDQIDIRGLPESMFIVPAGKLAGFIVRDPPAEGGVSANVESVYVLAEKDTPVRVSSGAVQRLDGGVTLTASQISVSGSGFTVKASGGALDTEAMHYLVPEQGDYFREGMVSLPEADKNKVMIIQQFMKSRGLYNCRAGCEIDGLYGPNTALAVAEWQLRYNEKRNLDPGEFRYLWTGGLWGPLTRAAVFSEFQFKITPQDGIASLSPQGVTYALQGNDVQVEILDKLTGKPLRSFVLQDGAIWLESGQAAPTLPVNVVAVQTEEVKSREEPPAFSVAAMLEKIVVHTPPPPPPEVTVDPKTGEIRGVDFTISPTAVGELAEACDISRKNNCGRVTRLLMNDAHGTDSLMGGNAVNEILGYPSSAAHNTRVHRALTKNGWQSLPEEAALQPYDVLIAGKNSDQHTALVVGYDEEKQLLVGHQWGRAETKILRYDDWVEEIKKGKGYHVRYRLRAPTKNLRQVMDLLTKRQQPATELAVAGAKLIYAEE